MNRSTRRIAALLAPVATASLLLAVPSGAHAIDFGKVKGWWPLAEGTGQTVSDWSGNRNHGTLGSTPGVDDNDPTWVKGIFGTNALSFDGNDFIKVPDSPALEQQQFTLSLWTRAAAAPGPFQYLLAKGSSSCTTASYALSTDGSGSVIFYVLSGGNWVRSGGAQAAQIWDGKWHNLAATYNGSTATLYLDGKSLGGDTGGGTVDYQLPDQTSSFGAYLGSCQLAFIGDLDQVMLFDRVLPIEEIWSKFGFILNKPSG